VCSWQLLAADGWRLMPTRALPSGMNGYIFPGMNSIAQAPLPSASFLLAGLLLRGRAHK
jgi:hypothetical protein